MSTLVFIGNGLCVQYACVVRAGQCAVGVWLCNTSPLQYSLRVRVCARTHAYSSVCACTRMAFDAQGSLVCASLLCTTIQHQTIPHLPPYPHGHLAPLPFSTLLHSPKITTRIHVRNDKLYNSSAFVQLNICWLEGALWSPSARKEGGVIV